MAGLAGNNPAIFVTNNGQPTHMPENFIFEQVDPSLDDDDSDSEEFSQGNQHGFLDGAGPKPGKKTKGRVKIKMEFIQNKLRRYTTFSKRKTGIMKKAYELSTLTGTQVMLLVASETGHVYTFATRKLQPMITSESGKALIQTCLNSPDPPPGAAPGNVLEQRMKPTGFEEPELTCVTGEEDAAKPAEPSFSQKPVFPEPMKVSLESEQAAAVTLTQREVEAILPSSAAMSAVVPSATFTIQQAPPQAAVVGTAVGKEDSPPGGAVLAKPVTVSGQKALVASVSAPGNNVSSTGSSTFPPTAMQIPLIIPQGAAISMLQASSQPSSQHLSVSAPPPLSTQPQASVKPAALSQVVSAINSYVVSSSQNGTSGELNTPLPVSTPSAINIMQGMTPGIVMYQTPQGVVYATPTQNIQDRTIFNFQQPASTFSIAQPDQASGQQQSSQASAPQQQIILPVPVSLSGTPLLLAAPPSVESSSNTEATQIQAPPLKKAKK